jgi:hypothetical protein
LDYRLRSVCIAGKVVTGGKATFGEGMLATLLGPIVYAITLVILDFLLGTLTGSIGYAIALVLAFIAWVWVYKASFKTVWLGGLAIAILAIIIFIVLGIIIGLIFNTALPSIPGHVFPQL